MRKLLSSYQDLLTLCNIDEVWIQNQGNIFDCLVRMPKGACLEPTPKLRSREAGGLRERSLVSRCFVTGVFALDNAKLHTTVLVSMIYNFVRLRSQND